MSSSNMVNSRKVQNIDFPKNLAESDSSHNLSSLPFRLFPSLSPPFAHLPQKLARVSDYHFKWSGAERRVL